MASSYHGSKIDTELTSLGINTDAEVATFRALPRRQSCNKTGTAVNNFQTVHDNVANTFSSAAPKVPVWVSRKRIRHDTLRLLREGAL